MAVKGVPQLRSRIKAITPDRDLMRALALSAVREQKLLVPRKTGNLGRSIHNRRFCRGRRPNRSKGSLDNAHQESAHAGASAREEV